MRLDYFFFGGLIKILETRWLILETRLSNVNSYVMMTEVLRSRVVELEAVCRLFSQKLCTFVRFLFQCPAIFIHSFPFETLTQHPGKPECLPPLFNGFYPCGVAHETLTANQRHAILSKHT